MESNKVKKVIILIIVVFVVSLLYTIVDTYPWNITSYDMGRYTGIIFKHIIKVLGLTGLFILLIRNSKKWFKCILQLKEPYQMTSIKVHILIIYY